MRTGTASTCSIPRRRGSAASISASCRARAGATSRHPGRRGRRESIDVLYLLGADEIDIGPPRRWARPSSSTRAIHGDAARTVPTSSCRAPPIPRSHATYVNTEGRVQLAAHGDLPAGRGARGLGDPARALGFDREARARRRKLPYDSCASGMRPRRGRHTRRHSCSPGRPDFEDDPISRAWGARPPARRTSMDTDAVQSVGPTNFYMTDPISPRLPFETMARPARRRLRAGGASGPTGVTHG